MQLSKIFVIPKTREQKAIFVFNLVLRLLIVLAIIGSILNFNLLVLTLSITSLILTFIPLIAEKRYKIFLPAEFQIGIILFIYLALFIGQVKLFYIKIWWWDIIAHFSAGIALGFVGFLILYILYDEKRIRGDPIVIAMFSFCFALAMGALWEILEFTLDKTLHTNNQLNSLIDTMIDLIMDALGALITAILGYIYLKKGTSVIFQKFLHRFVSKNPHLFPPKIK